MPHATQKCSRFGVAQVFESLGNGVLAPALWIALERLVEQPLECVEKIGEKRSNLELGRNRRRFGHDHIHSIAQRLPQRRDYLIGRA